MPPGGGNITVPAHTIYSQSFCRVVACLRCIHRDGDLAPVCVFHQNVERSEPCNVLQVGKMRSREGSVKLD